MTKGDARRAGELEQEIKRLEKNVEYLKGIAIDSWELRSKESEGVVSVKSVEVELLLTYMQKSKEKKEQELADM